MTRQDFRKSAGPGRGDVTTLAPRAEAVQRAVAHAHAALPPSFDSRRDGAVALVDPRAAGLQDPIQVTATVGISTKVKIAIAMGLHETVATDLVIGAAHDVLATGAQPQTFQHYHSCGELDERIAHQLSSGIAEGCRQAQCAYVGGTTTELPGVYETGEYGLAGVCMGSGERTWLLPRPDLAEGDVLLGLASSGAHAHGFTLIRRIVSSQEIGYRDPAPFHPSLSLGQALLTPTRCYVPQVLTVLRETNAVKGIAVVGEGGLTGGMSEALPPALAARIDLASWRMPAVFHWLRQTGNLGASEMLGSFNCGIGTVLMVDKLRTVSVLKTLREMGEKPLAIGTLVLRASGDPVRYSGTLA